MDSELPPPPDVTGASLSGSEDYVISDEENRLLCRSINIEPDKRGRAHPVFYYIATQVGMGATVGEICTICDFDVNQGPMMASSAVKFHLPLMTGQAYRVQGDITAINRKRSRKLGVLDFLDYELRLLLPDETVVLTASNTWALPRRELA